MSYLKQNIEYAKSHPETEFAKTLYQHITSGKLDEQAANEGIDLSWAGRPKIGASSNAPEDTQMKESGGIKGFLKSAVRAPATMLARPIQATAALMGGDIDKIEETTKKIAGDMVAPIPRDGDDLKKDVGRGIQTMALGAAGPISGGAAFGLGSSLEQGNDLLSTETAVQTALGAAAGKVFDLVGKPLMNSAGKVIGKITPQYIKDVAAKGTNEILKFAKAHQILPEATSKALSAGAETLEKTMNAPFKAAGNIPSAILGKGMKATGEKIQQSVIKPSIRDMKDGFKVENITKHDVGGSLEETIAKSHTKMNQLTKELKNIQAASDARVDINQVIAETKKSLMSKTARTFGDNKAIARVLNDLQKEAKIITKGKPINLVDATNMKRGAGTKGAWAYNRPEADSSAIEKVYTEFYGKLKTAIDTLSPKEAQLINQQLSELIPINNAAVRRLPIEQRNNALSLSDSIGLFSTVFDPKALAMLGGTKLAKSGKFGNLLSKGGNKLIKGVEKNIQPKMSSLKTTNKNPSKNKPMAANIKKIIPKKGGEVKDSELKANIKSLRRKTDQRYKQGMKRAGYGVKRRRINKSK